MTAPELELPARTLVPIPTETALPTLPPGLQAIVQLAILAASVAPVRWLPMWERSGSVVIRDGEQLAGCIASLAPEEFGGIQMDGSGGPWCQVKNVGDGADEMLLELHPHIHDRTDRPMLFERLVPVSAGVAAEFAWAWVRGKGLPGGYELEARIVPEGAMYDTAL